MVAEYIKDADEYYDLRDAGLIDGKEKVVSHHEQHEFMMGYRDDYSEKREREDLTTMVACFGLVACL